MQSRLRINCLSILIIALMGSNIYWSVLFSRVWECGGLRAIYYKVDCVPILACNQYAMRNISCSVLQYGVLIAAEVYRCNWKQPRWESFAEK